MTYKISHTARFSPFIQYVAPTQDSFLSQWEKTQYNYLKLAVLLLQSYLR